MPVQLMLVEDNPADALYLQTALKLRYPGEFDTTVATTLCEANALLDQHVFDAALLDLSLPDSHGLATIGQLAMAAPSLPIVVLTGMDDARIAPRAVRCGAQDYLLKGRSDGETISRAIQYAMDRKQTEEELRKSRDELEMRVQQRTEQLSRANADLRLAKEAAEAANRAKSVFLANMSHEMRSPLNAVIGMTELVLKAELPPEQREFLSMAKEAGEVLLGLIDEILDLSRIEAGKQVLAAEAFDLRESLEGTMKPLALRARQQGLQLAWHVHRDVPRQLLGDYSRLRQIVTNLVGNAIKFTEQGEIVLDAALEASSSQEAVLHFMVRDTGIGIPSDKQAKIFGMFEQVDTSLTRTRGGAGLGLAIASQLVGLMGGRIWVESDVGRGSRFHFTVRLGEALPIAPPASGWAEAASPQPRRSEKLRILLAEDSMVNQTLIVALLKEQGHAVTAVNRGAKVLAALQSEAFDLILMDVQMPEMDGLQVTAKIRDRERQTGGHIPIIALTAHALTGDREQCLTAGMDAYLTKPIRPRELFNVIEGIAWPAKRA